MILDPNAHMRDEESMAISSLDLQLNVNMTLLIFFETITYLLGNFVAYYRIEIQDGAAELSVFWNLRWQD